MILRFILKALGSRDDGDGEIDGEEGSLGDLGDLGDWEHNMEESKLFFEAKEFDHIMTQEQYLFCIEKAMDILQSKFQRDYAYHLRLGMYLSNTTSITHL